MDWSRQCAVVIPCHNEAGSIAGLVKELRDIAGRVVVVDDGSSDGTAGEAARAGADVLAHPAAKGKGSALRAGWRRARDLGFEWVLSMDGDGQHAPADIPMFFRKAEETNAALIVGNRMLQAGRIPLVRRAVNRCMSSVLSRVAGRSLPDSQCGFRLMRLDAWSRIPLHATHFEIESEQLLSFVAGGERVEFVPVQVIYRRERSKISPWRDTLRWLRWLRQWRREHGLTGRR